MSRLTDVDALLDDVFERYCKDCERRKGIKNGKYRIIYEVGEAPCRACDVDDMKCELDDAPTVDAVEVVRCKDCKHRKKGGFSRSETDGWTVVFTAPCDLGDDGFCSRGEKMTE